MTEREKMLAGELYDCGDQELLTQWHKAKNLIREYNNLVSENLTEKTRILSELLGGYGPNLWITAPFYADYGNNIFFGNNCEVNMNCTFLDDNKIIIVIMLLLPPMCRYTQLFIQLTQQNVLALQYKMILFHSAKRALPL